MSIKHYLILLIALAIGSLVSAQESIDSIAQVEAWDNSIVDYRCPSADTIAYFQSLEEYQYSTNNDLLTWWQRFLRWFFSFFRMSDGTFSLIGWLILILGVAIIAYMVIRLLGIPIKGLFVFSKSTKVTQLSFGLNNDDIESDELEKMLKVFIQNQAYREATRILFLLSLRELQRKSHIKWNAFKTDREYYYEVQNKDIKAGFLEIIRLYEFIWFGKLDINEVEFAPVKADFDQFILTIKDKHTN